MTVNMQQIESSSISSIGYHEGDEILFVTFKKKGAAWTYKNVPKDVYESLIKSKSVGKYFHEVIKPSYEAQRVHQS
uniref:Putative RNA binding domain protein n=1 Tax=viral metagenome TaxID=1070528 RepID=A0A6M3KJ32_9ZZZZ